MRADIVLRNAPAVEVQKREVVLSIGVALVCCLPKPTHRIRVILRNAPSALIHHADSVLSLGVTSVSEWTQKAHRGCVVTAVPRV